MAHCEFFLLLSGCVQGQHLSGEDGCSACEVGSYQNETFTLESLCTSCDGTEFSLKLLLQSVKP